MKCIQLNENNVIVNVCESDTVIFENGIIIDTDKSPEELFGKFKYEHEKLIECEQIDICPEPTDKERITQLESEKAILAENVYQLATILEAMIGGTKDGQSSTTTNATAN